MLVNLLPPLIAASVVGATLGIFSPYLTWKLFQREKLTKLSKNVKQYTWTTIIALTLLHLCEAFKSVAFGLQYRGEESLLGIL